MKQVTIGCRGDALSPHHLERACAALHEAHPHAEFVGAVEPAGRAGVPRAKASAAGSKETFADAPFAANGARRPDARRSGAVIQKLLRGEIDVAVVEGRAVPLQLPVPLEIVAVLERTNPFDALVSCDDLILDEQPENACIAAVEAVKRGQLLYYRPDLRLVEGEDDFESLFSSMRQGVIGSFVYPAAHVEALNQQHHVVEVFTASICTPPGGQGALALLARRDRREICLMLRDLNDPSSAAEIELERMLLECLTKDGRGPVGVLGNVEGIAFGLEAAVAAPDGTEKIAGAVEGSLEDRDKIIQKLSNELLASGGDEIIASYRRLRGSG